MATRDLPGREERSRCTIGNEASKLRWYSPIDDSTLLHYRQKKFRCHLCLSPPVARVAKARARQQIKIKKMLLTAYRINKEESLFYLKVLDIPNSTARKAGKNALKFAMLRIE